MTDERVLCVPSAFWNFIADAGYSHSDRLGALLAQATYRNRKTPNDDGPPAEEDERWVQLIPYVLVFDERGQILNIADGALGDVAFITSNKGAMRANHIHVNDWHLTYLINGHMLYQWDELSGSNRKSMMEIKAGQLFFTPPNTAHKMTFLEESSFIAVSGLNRDQATYESDTRRLESDYFNDAGL